MGSQSQTFWFRTAISSHRLDCLHESTKLLSFLFKFNLFSVMNFEGLEKKNYRYFLFCPQYKTKTLRVDV